MPEKEAFDDKSILLAIKRFKARPDKFTSATFSVGSKKLIAMSDIKKRIERDISSSTVLDIYFHIPVCEMKCGFCHYASFPMGKSSEQKSAEFGQMLEKESEMFAKYFKDVKKRPLNSLYFGGGTPNLMPISTMKTLIEHIRNTFIVGKNTEFTMEGRPNTWTEEKIEAAKVIGVNRTSIGVQTLNDTLLKAIKRNHDAEAARKSLQRLIEEFPIVNADVMYGLPGINKKTRQTTAIFIETLREFVELNVPSITFYRLRMNPRKTEGSKFATVGKEYEQCPEKFPAMVDTYLMQMKGREYLISKGYCEKPVGWFTKGCDPKFLEGRWLRNNPQIGFGAGAYSHTKHLFVKNYGQQLDELNSYIEAIKKKILPFKEVTEYTKEEFVARQTIFILKSNLSFDTRKIEIFENGSFYETKTGNIIEILTEEGFLTKKGNIISLSNLGIIFSEEIFSEIWQKCR